jgi:hypothetical protein
VVIGLAAATGVAVLGLVVAAGGGAMLWSLRSSAAWTTKHRASEVVRLEQDVARSAAALKERHDKVAAVHRTVPTTAAALRQLLAPPAEALGPVDPVEDGDRVP